EAGHVPQTLLQPTCLVVRPVLQRPVPDEAYEARQLGIRYYTQGEECGEDVPVLASGRYIPADANDTRLPGRHVSRQVAIVRGAGAGVATRGAGMYRLP